MRKLVARAREEIESPPYKNARTDTWIAKQPTAEDEEEIAELNEEPRRVPPVREEKGKVAATSSGDRALDMSKGAKSKAADAPTVCREENGLIEGPKVGSEPMLDFQVASVTGESDVSRVRAVASTLPSECLASPVRTRPLGDPTPQEE